ncbi:hypothetical protein [Vibrio tasmaniensis]|uniref:hypothetical protein n=1 Tax=Vibrio tasmaniensis TaxID=212663 RepID=UPI00111B8425|nr:hypothetical protein [Vibrio tasmaniensis]
MQHIVFLFILYVVLLGYHANQTKDGNRLSREVYESLYLLHTLAYYCYASLNAWLGDAYPMVISLGVAGFLNLMLVEYYWNKYDDLISVVKKSLTLKVIYLVVTSVAVSGTILYAGLMLEEITLAPASALNNYVIAISFILMAIFGPILLALVIEVVFPLVFFIGNKLSGNKIKNKPVVFISVIMLVAPLLIIASILESSMLNDKFFKAILHDNYHENDKGICSNIPDDVKYVPISASEVSVVKYDSEIDDYHFYLDYCAEQEDETGGQ